MIKTHLRNNKKHVQITNEECTYFYNVSKENGKIAVFSMYASSKSLTDKGVVIPKFEKHKITRRYKNKRSFYSSLPVAASTLLTDNYVN